jgi:endonuclease/exonuclease/phosphatase family metal-dependent hydrolase
VRVATYNIHHGVGLDGRLDLDRTARAIAATGATLVGLQEVDRHFGERSGFADQAAELAGRLGLEPVFGADIDRPPPAAGAPRRQYGNAILSGYPVLSSANTRLPRPEGTEQRGLLQAVVEVDGGPVTLFCTHLQHDSASARQAQADEVARIVAATAGPVVLVGDLNARPDASEVRTLTAILVDAWATAGQGRGDTFNALFPRARIDYVLSSPDLVARRPAVVRAYASDHRPLGTGLESAGPAAGP